MERDDDLRIACFLALDALQAQFGSTLPFSGALDRGFVYLGTRVPFMNRQKGIFRSRLQRGPAALSVQTSHRSPYDDQQTDLGFLYAYRAGNVDQPDNRALRAAFELQVPLAYFVATRPGAYEACYPFYVSDNSVSERRVVLTPGDVDRAGPAMLFEPIDDEIQRRYEVRERRQRLHQARFRGLVLPAYHDQCAICRLKEIRLLDAAHIAPDADSAGGAVVTNGLSLCTIHHRAFDADLVGISANYRVHVAPRLLEDEDGPMLDLLKGFHSKTIELPHRASARPDRDRLAERFEQFEKRR